VATLRIEGPLAVEAVALHFRARGGRRLSAEVGDRLVVGHFGGPPGEEVVVRVHSRRSLELHCHGGQAAVDMIEQTLIGHHAHAADWRQWIARTEPDPIAAAAWIALADARTERTAAILLDQYHGALRRAIAEIESLRHRGDAAAATRRIDELLARAPLGRHLVSPWRVVLAGRPNVGKSSLINALVGYARAIVHPLPGTTRDVVTAGTAFDGWPVELADTAGLHPAGDALERAGMERAQQQLVRADLVVLVFDRSLPWTEDDDALLCAWPGALVVYNKSDLPAAEPGGVLGLIVSALVGEGIEQLAGAISARLVPDPPPPGSAVPWTDQQISQVEGMKQAYSPRESHLTPEADRL
jgi:tRNA modification GTPase